VAERWKFNCVMILIVANKYNFNVQLCLGGG
jgi:hypothetical protein